MAEALVPAPIGNAVRRVDGPLKVTGAARYAAEYDAPDLLHGFVVPAAIASGRVVAIDTAAAVSFQPGTGITGIALTVTGTVPGLTPEQFAEAANGAKEGCPVSQALKAVPITLEARLTD